MTEARKAARAAAQEVITQTESAENRKTKKTKDPRYDDSCYEGVRRCDARKAAKAAAQEVIRQTEIAIKDLRTSLRQRAWEAAFDASTETPWQYRDTRQNREGHKIAKEIVAELLGGKE